MSFSSGEPPFPDFSSLVDSELVHFALRGSAYEKEAAWRAVYERYAKGLRRRINSRIHDWQQTEELVQEVFKKAAQHLVSLREPSNLKKWLYRIAENISLDQLRVRQRLPGIISLSSNTGDEHGEIEDLMRSPENMEESVGDREILLNALRSLPTKERQALLLSRCCGLSHREVAQRLNIDENSVATYVKRAVEKLRKYMERHGGL